MAAEGNEAVVRTAYEAFARQDIPGVLATFDPDIEWHTPDELPFGGEVRGHDGVVGFFQSLPTYFEELHVEPDTFVASDDRVVAIGHHRGRIKGQPFDAGFAMAWIMRNGKAIAFLEYNDSGKILRLLEG